MNLAYVLINTEMGSEEKVTNALNKIEEIKEVYAVYGVRARTYGVTGTSSEC